MGFLGTALGIGEHGSATIVLDRDEFVAGDVVAGRVRLSVATRIARADSIRMAFTGRETLAYDEEELPMDRPRDPENTDAVRRVRREKFEYSILSDEIVLDVPARAYEPGVYEFPFEYQLPPRGLVPSFHFKCSSLGSLSSVVAHAVYELRVRVPIEGMLTADLMGICEPVIRADPSLKAPCSVTESKTIPVYYCVFWHNGSCGLTATLLQNVVPIGGEARVDVLVSNDSKRPVDRVSSTLSQIVTLNETRKNRDGRHRASAKVKVASRSIRGVEPASTLTDSLFQPIAHNKKGSTPLIPTMRTHFLSFDYELTVNCSQSWCWEDPRATFPIVLTTKTV